MNGSRFALVFGLIVFSAFALASRASAAPRLFERFGQYRIVDASGRIEPRGVSGTSDRVALRPAYPPPWLLRGRPLTLSSYAGATYGPRRPAGPLSPTTHHVGHHGHGR